jgi:hypothetical protein
VDQFYYISKMASVKDLGKAWCEVAKKIKEVKALIESKSVAEAEEEEVSTARSLLSRLERQRDIVEARAMLNKATLVDPFERYKQQHHLGK